MEIGGQLFWTALFEQVAVTGWTVESVPVIVYQDTFDANVDAGRIPIYVHEFSAPGGPFLTGIWVDPVGGSTAAVHGLSAGDYQTEWDANTGAGRLTRAVTGYDDSGGNARFAAVWRVRPNTTMLSTPPSITNQTTATFTFEADNPFTTFECRLDGASFSLCTSPRNLTNLSEGNHTFRARAVDRQILRDLSPASFSWLVDLTPPIVDILIPVEDTKTVHGVPKDDPVDTTTVIGWADVVAFAHDELSGVASAGFKVDGIEHSAGCGAANRGGGEHGALHERPPSYSRCERSAQRARYRRRGATPASQHPGARRRYDSQQPRGNADASTAARDDLAPAVAHFAEPMRIRRSCIRIHRGEPSRHRGRVLPGCVQHDRRRWLPPGVR